MDDKNYHKFLLKYIDEVLHYLWDPIGISDTPEARNEYKSYTNRVYKEVIQNKTLEDIVIILNDIERDRMNLDISHEVEQRNEKVAEIILEWSSYLKSDMSVHLLDKN